MVREHSPASSSTTRSPVDHNTMMNTEMNNNNNNNKDVGEFSRYPSMQITTHRTPHPFFTPTHLSLGPHQSNQGKSSTSEWQSRTTSEWQSRKARKGRYAPKSTTVHYTPDSTHNQPGRLEKEEKYIRDECILRAKDEKTKFKPGLKFDISFWEASLFTLGSVFWVINGE